MKWMIYLLFISIGIQSNAQDLLLSPYVINIGGGLIENESEPFAFSYSIGEMAISTLPGASYYFSQGFEQPYESTTSIPPDLTLENWDIRVFPNPAIHYLNIDVLEKMPDENLWGSIWNIVGQMQFQLIELKELGHYQIQIDALPPGTYFLQLLGSEEKKLTYKFQKI